MFCPKCGTHNPDDAKSCISCMQDLALPGQTAQLAEGEVIYAGFWERYAAAFLDNIILSAVYIPVIIVIAVASAVLDMGETVYMILSGLSYYTISMLYRTLMESGEKGSTLGKRWLKMRVVDLAGKRISKPRAFARWISSFFSGILLFIGYVMQPFTSRKQALHDMMSGTQVIRTDRSSNKVAIIVSVSVTLFFGFFYLGILAAVAIPAYQDYIAKAQINQGVSAGTEARLAVEKYFQRTGQIPASLNETGTKLILPPVVASVEVSQENGDVTVQFQKSGSGVNRALTGKSIIFHPEQADDGSINWTCRSEDIKNVLLPKECRH